VLGLSKLAKADMTDHARAALHALGNMGGQAASNALEELAASPGPLQGMALASLAQQPEAAERARALALSLLDQGDDAPSSALGILARDDSPEAHAALLRAARAGAQQSQRAIWLLAKRDDPESLNVLSEIARTPDAPNRISALSALAEGGSPQAADVMRDALRAEDPSVRAEAVSRFGGCEAPDVEQAMLAASRDPADGVGREALKSLASAAPERAATVVDVLIQTGDSNGLQSALAAVPSLPMDATQRVLERALTSTDGEVLSEALSQLQSSECDPSSFTEALDRLARDAQLPSDVRDQARNLLLGDVQ
jgi:HEAT repeat protein